MIKKFILWIVFVLAEFAIYAASNSMTALIDPTSTESLAFMDMLNPILRLIVIVLGVSISYLTVLILIHGLMLVFPSRNKRGVF